MKIYTIVTLAFMLFMTLMKTASSDSYHVTVFVLLKTKSKNIINANKVHDKP